MIHVEEPDLAVVEAIKLLSKYNVGLDAREWVVVSESRDTKSAHFSALIDGVSLEALKINDFIPLWARSNNCKVAR